jgi:hypothetical protein
VAGDRTVCFRHGTALPDRLLIGELDGPGEGWEVYRQLEPYLVSPEFETRPTAAYACPIEQGGRVAQPSPQPEGPRVSAKVPKLLKTYMAIGARIGGPPAWDRDFGSIDFLTLLDSEVDVAGGAQALSGSADEVNFRAIRRAVALGWRLPWASMFAPGFCVCAGRSRWSGARSGCKRVAAMR